MTVSNLVKQKSTTTGTGDFTLSAATGGFQTCHGAFSTNPFFYYIIHATLAEWECGYSNMSDATTLVRTSGGVIASSNAGSLVNFSAGDKIIVNDMPASFQNTQFKRARVASSANVNISSAPSSIDGITMASGDIVLLWLQSTGSQNGLWIYKGSGSAMVRAYDTDTDAELRNCVVVTSQGTNYAGWMFRNSNTTAITVGTTAVSFVRYPQASTGLQYVSGGSLAIANTGISAGSYVYGGSYVLEPAINAQGQWTAITVTPIAITHTQVTDWDDAQIGISRGKTVAIAENTGA